MSVIVGCSLFDGVMLAADCRATISRKNGSVSYSDNIQKLFALTANTSIGFAGDIGLAGKIIKDCISQTRKRRRKDAISMVSWLPLYFRTTYSRINPNPSKEVKFMVASVIPERPNIVEREKVVTIINRIMDGTSRFQRKWIPEILVNILKTPANIKYVNLVEHPRCLLFILEPPNFVPKHIMPLDYAAIGSGQEVVVEIDGYHDIIFASEVGNPSVESFYLRECIRSFIRERNIETVGGLYPCLKINKDGTKFLGHSAEIPVGGTKIELKCDRMGRWAQKNLTTGKIVQLLFPREAYKQDKTFDDLDEVLINRQKRSS